MGVCKMTTTQLANSVGIKIKSVSRNAGSRVIASKLSPPLTHSLVPRPEIHERLFEAGASAKLVLLSAPPGFGKTSLMAQHHALLRAKGVRVSWLTLGQADNDMAVSYTHLTLPTNREV